MLEHPERLHVTSKSIVERLKRLQLILGKNHVKKNNEKVEGGDDVKLIDLPTELLVQIFSYLESKDLRNLCQVCNRVQQICIIHRNSFSRVYVKSIALRYGFYRDVLKHRIVPNENQTTISYRLLNDDFRVKPKKTRRSGFLRRQNEIVPFTGIVQNCLFETVFLTCEMLNADFRTALHLKHLNSTYLFCDFSHHSLQSYALQRYLPSIAEDLNTNLCVRRVDFIFQSLCESSDGKLENIIREYLCDKKVTVIFLRSRCGL